jgi:Protein of unknown function (DUF2809)
MHAHSSSMRRCGWLLDMVDSAGRDNDQDLTPPAARLTYITLASVTIALGLWVHRGGAITSPVIRDVLGDALWAAMMLWLLSALAPDARPIRRGNVALLTCFSVEVSQLFHTPWLDAIRQTPLGHLVLGSGFDPRDFLAYTIGVAAALLIDRMFFSNRVTSG